MPLRRKLAWIAMLYFAEGLPFGIVKEMVPVYFKVSGVSLTDIGLASLLGLPWTLKVAWSPLVDRYGERRRWIIGCLIVLALFTSLTPLFDPAVPTLGLWAVLLAITIASATQDVAIDAYTIGLVEPGEEGDANGIRVSAYRVALIASGGGLVLLAPLIGWSVAFLAAALMLVVLAVCTTGAPRIVVPVAERRNWLEPMRRWLARRYAWAVFLFVLIYKLGDAAMGPMIKPFWIDRGLAVSEIGLVSTSLGVLATIAGALIGGRLTSRWGILRALFLLGLAQALSNLGYASVAWINPPLPQQSVASLSDALLAVAEPGRGLIYAASMIESFCRRPRIRGIPRLPHARLREGTRRRAVRRPLGGVCPVARRRRRDQRRWRRRTWATRRTSSSPSFLRFPPSRCCRSCAPGSTTATSCPAPCPRHRPWDRGRPARSWQDRNAGGPPAVPEQRTLLGELGNERPIDAILQPPRPAAAPGERAVAENGAPVGSIEQREKTRLRLERAHCATAHCGAQIVRQNRCLAHRVDAGFGERGVRGDRRAISGSEDLGHADTAQLAADREEAAFVDRKARFC